MSSSSSFVPSPQQQAIFENIREGEGHTVVVARAGCLSGDTMIGLNRAGKGFALKLSEVVRRFRGGRASGKTWRENIDTYVRAPFPDGTVRLTKLVAAIDSGLRETVVIRIGSRRLQVTPDHELLTPTGFVAASKLHEGDVVFVEEKSSGRGRVKKRNYLSRSVPCHPHAVSNGENGRKKVPTHRLNVEANMNGLDLEAFVWRLQTSSEGLKFLSPELHVHHKDNNVQNNGLDNLEVLTGEAHNRLHIGEGMWTKMVLRPVISIKSAKAIQTYDLTVPGPDAFMANGIAVHNCGKTTTIVEGMKELDRRLRQDTLMVAFNKAIAKELAERAPSEVTVSTLHSYGLRQISRAIHPRPQVDEDKLRPILAEVVGTSDRLREQRTAVKRLVSLAKATLSKSEEGLDALIDAYGIDVPCESETEEAQEEARALLITNTQEVIAKSLEIQEIVDFDDMIYFPCALKMHCDAYARVFVDETQDLNASQLKLALKACEKGGRVLAVGDNLQAIYGFRGAAEGAVDLIIERLEAKVLKLTVTRRCPKKVVALANRYVTDFEALPDAPEGSVRDVYYNSLDPEPGDFVLSRTNAPLVPLCFRLLREGKRVAIQGRDIGARLRSTILKTKAVTVTELSARLQKWRDREIARLLEAERDTTFVTDTVECIHALSEGAASVDEVLGRIDRLFSDDGMGDKGKIVLSTTHKAKGLERDRVWLLRDTYLRQRRKKYDADEWETLPLSQEEINLFYVAVTRAKRELVLVSEG